MTSKAVTIRGQQLAVLAEYTRDEVDLIRATVAKDCSDLELAFFFVTARARGLNPFARQIYAVKYGGRLALITGIDGYRSIAEETGEYAGNDDYRFDEGRSDFEMLKDGR